MSKYLLVLSAMLMALPAVADFSTNMGAATKQTFRGVKQSNKDFVFSAGADYQGPLGFYAGAWGYTGSIEDFDTSEVNAYGGFAFNVKDLSVGLGVIRYERAQQTGFSEYNVNLAWDAYRLSTYQDEDATYQYNEIAANYNFWGTKGMAFTFGLLDQDATADVVADEIWNYSITWVLAMPGNVDFDFGFGRHEKKGNSLTLSMSKQIDW